MKVSFNGIGERLVTFLNGGAEKGGVVKVSAAGTVAPCAAGDGFDGVAVFVDGEFAGVRLGGFAAVSYSGTAPAAGHSKLSADGEGGVKTDSSGKDYLVVDVDSAAQTVTILM